MKSFVKLIQVFGRAGRLRWESHCVESQMKQRDKDFSSIVADHLNQDKAVKVGLSSSSLYEYFFVEAALDLGCWVLFIEDDWLLLYKERWECYQAIAQCLLAMPMPTEE